MVAPKIGSRGSSKVRMLAEPEDRRGGGELGKTKKPRPLRFLGGKTIFLSTSPLSILRAHSRTTNDTKHQQTIANPESPRWRRRTTAATLPRPLPPPLPPRAPAPRAPPLSAPARAAAPGAPPPASRRCPPTRPTTRPGPRSGGRRGCCWTRGRASEEKAAAAEVPRLRPRRSLWSEGRRRCCCWRCWWPRGPRADS